MLKETGMYQYFVKVVPTTYKTNKGQVIADTYQYIAHCWFLL